MKAILIHGMGRTPISMWLLAYRLRRAGIATSCFGYSVTFEKLQPCLHRLQRYVQEHVSDERYIVVTHSLGSVLIRSALPMLTYQPSICFFLAPPTVACDAACLLSKRFWYRMLTGEMGQILANAGFMASLPIPAAFTKIYAGNAGLTGSYSPFGLEPNDAVLKVSETTLAGIQHKIMPSLHTFIMNNKQVSDDIIHTVQDLTAIDNKLPNI